MSRHKHFITAALAMTLATGTFAQEKFVYQTNWYAQAEHGGFYQAIAEGIYKKHGLDVTIKMGGPQLNGLQLMVAGQADCMMSADTAMLLARHTGAAARVRAEGEAIPVASPCPARPGPTPAGATS